MRHSLAVIAVSWLTACATPAPVTPTPPKPAEEEAGPREIVPYGVVPYDAPWSIPMCVLDETGRRLVLDSQMANDRVAEAWDIREKRQLWKKSRALGGQLIWSSRAVYLGDANIVAIATGEVLADPGEETPQLVAGTETVDALDEPQRALFFKIAKKNRIRVLDPATALFALPGVPLLIVEDPSGSHIVRLDSATTVRITPWMPSGDDGSSTLFPTIGPRGDRITFSNSSFTANMTKFETRLFDGRTGKTIARFDEGIAQSTVTFDPTGKRLIVDGSMGMIDVRDATTGALQRTREGNAAQWAGDGSAYTYTSGTSCVVEDAKTGALLYRSRPALASRLGLALDTDGSHVLDVRTDGIDLIDLRNASTTSILTAKTCTQVQWDARQRRGAVACDPAQIIVVDTERGAIVATIEREPNEPYAISPDGTKVAIARAGRLVVEEIGAATKDRRIVGRLSAHVASLVWSPEGKRIAARTWRQGLVIFDVDSPAVGTELQQEVLLDAIGAAIAFRPRSNEIAFLTRELEASRLTRYEAEGTAPRLDMTDAGVTLGYTLDGEVLLLGNPGADGTLGRGPMPLSSVRVVPYDGIATASRMTVAELDGALASNPSPRWLVTSLSSLSADGRWAVFNQDDAIVLQHRATSDRVRFARVTTPKASGLVVLKDDGSAYDGPVELDAGLRMRDEIRVYDDASGVERYRQQGLLAQFHARHR